jgi:hypothetical protein
MWSPTGSTPTLTDAHPFQALGGFVQAACTQLAASGQELNQLRDRLNATGDNLHQVGAEMRDAGKLLKEIAQ